MIRFIIICFIFSHDVSFASDGPQNTGILTLKRKSDLILEAQLQIDRTVFQESPADVLNLIKLSANEVPCSADVPVIIADENVVSAVADFECPGLDKTLTIGVEHIDKMNPGFTLGIRTNIDHFVLDQQNPQRETIISANYLFFLSGLNYFHNNHLLEQAHIGRPHILYFGGLTGLPTGVWFLFLTIVIWLTELRTPTKLVLTLTSIGLTAGLAVFILAQQASLSIFSVKTLGLSYLAMLFLTIGLTWFKQKRPIDAATSCALFLAICISGAEHAVVLRWLEGQQDIGMPGTVFSFFGGVGATILGLLTAGGLISYTLRRQNKESLLRGAKAFTKIALLGFFLYAATASIFKIL